MTEDQILEALVKWLGSKTSLTVVQAYENGDEPALPYITVALLNMSDVRENPSDIEYVNTVVSGENVVLAKPVKEVEWHFSLQCHGGTQPLSYLRPLRSIIELAQQQEPLFPGLTIHELSQIRNVPEFVKEKWEKRAQMDVFLRGLTRDGALIDVIEQHTITVETM